MICLCRSYIFQMTFYTQIFKHNTLTMSLLQLYGTMANENLFKWNKIKSKYSVKELQIVFDTLKTSSLIEMKKLGISENHIESLQTKKEKYTTLDDIVLHSTITVPELVNICTSIVSRKQEKAKKSSIVTPTSSKRKLESLKTIVGLQIKSNYISWSQLNITASNCNILNWDCQSISDLPLTADPIEVIKIGIKIAKSIPDSDAYVMEKESSKPMTKINNSSLRLLLRQQQMISIVLTSLSTRKMTDDKTFDSFYMMKSCTSAHLFGLFLGNETVSATDVVQALLENQNVGLKNIKSLSINNAIINKHYSSNVYEKEEMNKSLLLALTFIEQIILGQK